MKKIMIAMLMLLGSSSVWAQKFALVDMDYILKNIPAYERASEQLNQVSKKWQAEVDVLTTEAQTLYKNYQSEAVFLSEEQKTKREEAIVAKEKEAAEIARKAAMQWAFKPALDQDGRPMECDKIITFDFKKFSGT